MHTDTEEIRLPQWRELPDFALYMDQVLMLMERVLSPALPAGEMTKSMINNYVKVGLVPRPMMKRYDRVHVALLMMIAVLKQALSMEEIAQVLQILCRKDAEDGYERFCRCMRRAEDTEGPESEQQEEQAVKAGITAAMCVIRARSMLRHMREAQTCGKN